VERSVEFWRAYLSDKPGDFSVVLENVLEDSPDELIAIVRGIDDPRFKLCLDMGHANITKTGLTMADWTTAVLPYLGHVHLHNNFGWPDSHGAPDDGEMDIEALLRLIIEGAPEATVTLEIRDSCRSSVEWMIKKGFLL
jgi:sugar phosphate isomerase/epimerase